MMGKENDEGGGKLKSTWQVVVKPRTWLKVVRGGKTNDDGKRW